MADVEISLGLKKSLQVLLLRFGVDALLRVHRLKEVWTSQDIMWAHTAHARRVEVVSRRNFEYLELRLRTRETQSADN